MPDKAYEVREETIGEVPLAIVPERAYAGDIGPKIMAASSRLYPELRALGVKGLGKDVVVYYPDERMESWLEPPGIAIDVGVQLQEPLVAESGLVKPSRTAGGRVATTVHRGPYSGLPEAHRAIHAHCEEHGLAVAGPNWEVYAQHEEADPSKLETQVFYLLASEAP